MMATTNAQLIKAHKAKQRRVGLYRLDAWISLAVRELLLDQWRPGECYGRTLERLLLGNRISGK